MACAPPAVQASASSASRYQRRSYSFSTWLRRTWALRAADIAPEGAVRVHMLWVVKSAYGKPRSTSRPSFERLALASHNLHGASTWDTWRIGRCHAISTGYRLRRCFARHHGECCALLTLLDMAAYENWGGDRDHVGFRSLVQRRQNRQRPDYAARGLSRLSPAVNIGRSQAAKSMSIGGRTVAA